MSQDVRGDSVVLASFPNRWAAESMLGSLGHTFRHKARKRGNNAFVISGNSDGSLNLTESRVLEARGLAHTLIKFAADVMVGFIGIGATLQGVAGWRRAAKTHAPHVGSDDTKSRAVLDQAGPDAAVAMVRCKDPTTRATVRAKATESAISSWDGSLTEFLASLDSGSEQDWIRDALGEPSADH